MPLLTTRQFLEWQEYFRIEPFGDDQFEGRHGVACALIANVNRDSKVKPEPFKAEDFMRGTPDDTEIELTEEQIDRAIDMALGVS